MKIYRYSVLLLIPVLLALGLPLVVFADNAQSGTIIFSFDTNGGGDPDCWTTANGPCVMWGDLKGAGYSPDPGQWQFCLDSAVKYATGQSDVSGYNITPTQITQQPFGICGYLDAGYTYASYSIAYEQRIPPITLSCSANPNPASTNQTVTFNPTVSGGTGSYTYLWSGACTGTSQTCTNTLNNQGSQTAQVTVTSGSRTQTASCSVNINQPPPTLIITCQSNPSSIQSGQSTTFISNVSGGTGSYSYSWSGSCAGSSVNCQNTFSNQGTYASTVTVTSGSQTQTTNCSVNVNAQNNNSYISCYGSDLYWFDQNGNRQGLYQSCANNNNYYNTGSNYCIGNSVYRQTNYSAGGCSGNACYNTNNNNNSVQLIQVCGSNQICQSGVCITTINNHDHKACYNNSVYWFDSNNSRNDVYQYCSSSQTCQNASCVTNYTPAYILHYAKGCYTGNLYWYDSLNIKQDLYKNCSDNNNCTADSCRNSACSNNLICDGTTCAINSSDYKNSCITCGDEVCSEGETFASCPEDCKGITGLAVNILGKRTVDSIQWTKAFAANTNESIDFLVVVSNGQDTTMNNVIARVDLPIEIAYNDSLTLDGSSYNGDIRTGVSLGSLAPGDSRAISFKGTTASNISRIETDTVATVSTSDGSSIDNVKVTFYGTTPTTVFNPQKGLAALFGINFSRPLYILLWVVIAIFVLFGVARLIQGWKK